MANVVEVHRKQIVVFDFLTVEGCSLIETHIYWRSVYGEDARDIIAVRCWPHCFKSGEKEGLW
jgi:hypothetical protein